jgi:hypothetical protein
MTRVTLLDEDIAAGPQVLTHARRQLGECPP